MPAGLDTAQGREEPVAALGPGRVDDAQPTPRSNLEDRDGPREAVYETPLSIGRGVTPG